MHLKLGDIGECEQCKRPESMVIPAGEKMVCFVCADTADANKLSVARGALERMESVVGAPEFIGFTSEEVDAVEWLIEQAEQRKG